MPDIEKIISSSPLDPEEERRIFDGLREAYRQIAELDRVSLRFAEQASDIHRRFAEMETHGLNWTDVALFTTYDEEEQDAALTRLSVQIAAKWHVFDREEYRALKWFEKQLGVEYSTAKRIAAREGLFRARSQKDEPQTVRFGKSDKGWIRNGDSRACFKPSVLGLPGKFSFVRWFRHKAIAEAGTYVKELFGIADKGTEDGSVFLLPLEEGIHESHLLDGLAYVEDQETQEELRGMLAALLDTATPRERDIAHVLLDLIEETGEDNISEAGRRLGIHPNTARELLRRVGKRRPDIRQEWL